LLRTEGERRFWIGILLLMLAVTMGNVVVASVGYLQLLMLGGLIAPASIFYSTIRDATRGDPGAGDPDPKEAGIG
jgi:hypothetical protein